VSEAGIVIVGAGEAGARAALALRENGWTGAVTLIGDEPHPPYERPPLSKAVIVAAGELDPPTILDTARMRDNRIDFLPGATVVRIDRGAHRLALADGRHLSYSQLLLATGSRARPLAIRGSQNLLYLRTYAEAIALRRRLQAGMRVGIIGGGFIGLELAASATARGCEVTVIEMAPRVLMRGVPEEIATTIADRHRSAGVDLRTGVGINGIEAQDHRQVIVTADGARIVCDEIIAGVGAVPETALAKDSGLDIENGIRVDGHLRTSDRDIFAAGDCCSFPHALYGDRRVRLEAWRNAQEQGATAARNMLGAATAHEAVPSFWSDQYNVTLRIVGLPDTAVSTVTRRLGDGACLYFHLGADGRLMAASGIGSDSMIAKEIRLAELLIARQRQPAPDELENPNVRLKSLLNS